MKPTIYERFVRNRAFVMGASILLLLVYHAPLDLGGGTVGGVLDYLFDYVGYYCVDVFFLVSGFGLYWSLKKEPAVRAFYRKRACASCRRTTSCCRCGAW